MNSAVESVSIGAVARRAGVRASTIRYYEGIGLLPPAERVGGWRQYDPGIVDHVRVIRSAQQLGFSLDEIRTLLYGYPEGTAPSARWRAVAESKLPEIDDLIRRALAMKSLLEAGLRCGCLRIEECFLDGCSEPEVSHENGNAH